MSQHPLRPPLLREEEEAGSSVAPTNRSLCRFQVLVTYNGQECPGLVEQHNLLSDKAKVPLPDKGLQPCWRVQDVQPPALPTAGSPGPSEALQRSVSSNIDVPKRFVPLAGDISGGRGILGSFASTCASFYTDRTAMLGIDPSPQRGIIQRMV